MSTETTTTTTKAILTATGNNARHYDDATLRAYDLDETDIGRYAVIQHGVACLGVGDTREEALADAARCNGGEPVEECDDETSDSGIIEVVLILAD